MWYELQKVRSREACVFQWDEGIVFMNSKLKITKLKNGTIRIINLHYFFLLLHYFSPKVKRSQWGRREGQFSQAWSWVAHLGEWEVFSSQEKTGAPEPLGVVTGLSTKTIRQEIEAHHGKVGRVQSWELRILSSSSDCQWMSRTVKALTFYSTCKKTSQPASFKICGGQGRPSHQRRFSRVLRPWKTIC